MEMAGFARANVPGEYSPTPVSAALATDVTSNAAFVTILTATVYILAQGEDLTLVASFAAQQDFTGGTPVLRITVDGVDVGESTTTVPVGGSKANPRRVAVVSGLAPGPHIVTVDWRNGSNSFIKPATFPLQEHATLLCQRSRPSSDQELGGYPQLGWSMIYSEPQVYQALTANNTSTSATAVDPLFSGVIAQTRYAKSALLIRFTVSAVCNDTTNQLNNLYQILVDGVAVCGTGGTNGTSGFAGTVSGSGAIVLVPVIAGVHSIAVNWAGGAAPGSTVQPGLLYSHAAISAEEVFSNDIESLPDQEGFAAYGFASRNLPRVAYLSLKNDITVGGAQISLMSQWFYVTGEQSALLIEVTASLISNNQQANVMIYVDGALLQGTSSSQNNLFYECCQVEATINVVQGNHFVDIQSSPLLAWTPGSNPFSHANAVIREVARLAS